jgi:hypothetical protein
MPVSKSFLAAVAITLPLAFSTQALADHGKAGLWSIDMTIAGQNTANMPPAVADQMRAKGLIPNASGGFTLQRCMTQAEVQDDSKIINASANKDCQVTNQKREGQTVSASLVCKGQINGTGQVSIRYDSDTHYTSKMTIVASGPDGKPMQQNQTFEGHWVSATCPAQKH